MLKKMFLKMKKVTGTLQLPEMNENYQFPCRRGFYSPWDAAWIGP